MTGIDIAQGAIDFCRRAHRSSRLRFIQGDAEDIPLFDETADIVINLEASFCYGDIDRFFSEVRRVLRPGGYFLYSDLRSPSEMEGLLVSLQRSAFEIVGQEDITRNVARALRLDAGRRAELERAQVPWFLRHAMRTFAGAPGTRIPVALETGELLYFLFTLRKSHTLDLSATAQLARWQAAA
jgi:SAM-dependent methyltransferase